VLFDRPYVTINGNVVARFLGYHHITTLQTACYLKKSSTSQLKLRGPVYISLYFPRYESQNDLKQLK